MDHQLLGAPAGRRAGARELSGAAGEVDAAEPVGPASAVSDRRQFRRHGRGRRRDAAAEPRRRDSSVSGIAEGVGRRRVQRASRARRRDGGCRMGARQTHVSDASPRNRRRAQRLRVPAGTTMATIRSGDVVVAFRQHADGVEVPLEPGRVNKYVFGKFPLVGRLSRLPRLARLVRLFRLFWTLLDSCDLSGTPIGGLMQRACSPLSAPRVSVLC